MFTREIYRQYFREIHHKQREMIMLLRDGINSISEDRTQKALGWHMKREIRLAVLIQKLIRSLSSDVEGEEERISQALGLDESKFPFEIADKGRV